jgi:hypothetical protein
MPGPGQSRPQPLVWLGLTVLIALSLTFGFAAMRTSSPDVAASGPVIAIPEAPPAPLPDVKPKRGS